MANKSVLDIIRMRIMGALTHHIGASLDTLSGTLPAESVRRILLIRPNHRLGNLLLITPMIQELMHLFPHARIDVFAKGGVAPILFQSYAAIDDVILLPRKPFKALFQYARVWLSLRRKRYDLVVNVAPDSSSGRLATRFVRSDVKWYGDVAMEMKETWPGGRHIARYPVFGLRRFLNLPDVTSTAVPCLNIGVTQEEFDRGRVLLEAIAEPSRPTICLFTFATGEKCYPPQWWEDFHARLQTAYPGYNIVELLPVENVSQLSFKIPHYYSKEPREIAGFIANTDIFIGADSGMMHLASASQTPTIGLFRRINPLIYAPYNEGSSAFDTRESHDVHALLQLIDKALAYERRPFQAFTKKVVSVV